MSTVLWASYAVAIGGLASLLVSGAVIEDAAGPIMLAYSLTATVLAGRVARQWNLDVRSRRAWLMMAMAFGVMTVAYVLFARQSAGDDPLAFPTPGDGLRLLFAPILLAGLLWLPSPSAEGTERSKVALDIGIVMTSSAAVL